MSDAFFDDEIRNELKDLLPIQNWLRWIAICASKSKSSSGAAPQG